MKEQTTITILSILALIAGIAIRYIIARRKFNRRSMTGAERFRSYERAWSTTLGERLARIIANILIIVSILTLLAIFADFRFMYNK